MTGSTEDMSTQVRAAINVPYALLVVRSFITSDAHTNQTGYTLLILEK